MYAIRMCVARRITWQASHLYFNDNSIFINCRSNCYIQEEITFPVPQTKQLSKYSLRDSTEEFTNT